MRMPIDAVAVEHRGILIQTTGGYVLSVFVRQVPSPEGEGLWVDSRVD